MSFSLCSGDGINEGWDESNVEQLNMKERKKKKDDELRIHDENNMNAMDEEKIV